MSDYGTEKSSSSVSESSGSGSHSPNYSYCVDCPGGLIPEQVTVTFPIMDSDAAVSGNSYSLPFTGPSCQYSVTWDEGRNRHVVSAAVGGADETDIRWSVSWATWRLNAPGGYILYLLWSVTWSAGPGEACLPDSISITYINGWTVGTGNVILEGEY